MTTNDPEKLELLKQHSKRAFENANPEIWKKLQNDPEKIKQARNIENRARALHNRLKEHIEKHRKNWVAREVVKQFEKAQHLTLEHPIPEWALNQPNNVSSVEEARRKVNGRINNRILQISQIEQRMKNRLVQDQEKRRADFSLKSEVHYIIGRTQVARAKARLHFANHRDKWIENARNRGAKSPEREVFQKHYQRLSNIDKAEHRLIHEAFKDHGQSIPHTQKQSMTQDFNQAMG